MIPELLPRGWKFHLRLQNPQFRSLIVRPSHLSGQRCPLGPEHEQLFTFQDTPDSSCGVLAKICLPVILSGIITKGIKMTKRDFVVRIASELGLTQDQVAEVVQKTLDHISDEVAKGRTVELRNFGIFEVCVLAYKPFSI